MTKNGLDIQSISTRRTDKQADRVLLLGQVTENKEKAHPSHFLKFLFASRTNGTLGFARHTSRPFATAKQSRTPIKINYAVSKTQRAVFCQRTDNNSYFAIMYLNE
jgi:hypothetical protein